jgi:hypothetical protein
MGMEFASCSAMLARNRCVAARVFDFRTDAVFRDQELS